MTSDEMPLKPCPFCGGAVHTDGYGLAFLFTFVCKKCDARIVLNTSNEGYLKDWNTRADIVPEDKGVAEAVEWIKKYYLNEPHGDHNPFPYYIKTLIRAVTAKRDCEGLVRALEMVLAKVGGCHDCWELSSTKEEKQFVEKALAEYRKGKGEG